MSAQAKESTVIVTAAGVRFGEHCFMSHERLTGYSAEALNSGAISVTARAYMRWVSATLDGQAEIEGTDIGACALRPDGQDC